MTRFPSRAFGAFAICLCLALPWRASPALAHSIGWSQGTGAAVVLTFYYVGGGPMADADARLFAPGAGAAAFQVGRTDQLGRLSFLPDRAGLWRIDVVDGHGHEVVASATVTEAGQVRDPAAGLTGAILLSLTANLFLGIALWRTWRRGRTDRTALSRASAA